MNKKQALSSCILCKKVMTQNNISRHYDSKFCKREIRKNMTNIKCTHCGKICKNHNSWRNHTRTCPQNTNRNYKNGMTGKDPWNKGLTTESDDRVKKLGEAVSAGLRKLRDTGYVNPVHTQEYWTTEKRKAKSIWKKNLHKKNPELHPNRLLAGNKNKMTYPESVAYDTLVELGIEFEHQKKIENYYVDFCIGNTIIEIDGERWHPIGNSYDENRDSQLNSLGYLVHRIRSKEPISDRIKALFNRKL